MRKVATLPRKEMLFYLIDYQAIVLCVALLSTRPLLPFAWA